MARIIGLISLFEPIYAYCKNISIVAEMVDLLILLDDSEVSHQHIVNNVVSKKIVYRWNGCNIGLSKSINCGIDMALKEKPDWILIMDQDSAPETDIVSIYEEYIKEKNISDTAILAPQYDYDRHLRKAHHGNREIEFSNLSGSLLNVRALKDIGKFDERFMVDGLDVEWCLRAKKKGYRIIECSEAVIEHNPATSKFISIFGKKIFGYGMSPDYRHYYQIKACLIILNEYSSAYNLKMLIFKILKSLFFYGDIKHYWYVNKMAYADYKANYFGKYRYERKTITDNNHSCEKCRKNNR